MKTRSDFRHSFLFGVAHCLAILLSIWGGATYTASTTTSRLQKPPALTFTLPLTLPQEQPVNTRSPSTASPREQPKNAFGVGGSHGNG